MSQIDVINAGGDEIEPDQYKQEIIRSYIEEFRNKGCLNTVVRLLREALPEHIYIHLINAIDKEGSIMHVLFNAVRTYIVLMYIAPQMPAQPQQAPPQPQQPAPQQPEDVKQAIVSQVVAKVLERELGGGDQGGGDMFDLRSMFRQMIGMMFLPMMQQMMQQMQATMMRSMMPQMSMFQMAQQQQQKTDSKPGPEGKKENVQRLDIL